MKKSKLKKDIVKAFDRLINSSFRGASNHNNHLFTKNTWFGITICGMLGSVVQAALRDIKNAVVQAVVVILYFAIVALIVVMLKRKH